MLNFRRDKPYPFRGPLLGILLMISAFMVIDLVAFGTGADIFHRFDTTTGAIISITEEPIEIAKTHSGQYGAIYERRVRPLIQYQYDYQGKRYTHTRYFLVDNDSYSDPLLKRNEKNSVTASMLRRTKVGSAVVVKVATSELSLSYIEFGWPVVIRVCWYWIRIYISISVFWTLVTLVMVLGSLRGPSTKV